MRKIFSELGRAANTCIYILGWMTAWNYAERHWPGGLMVFFGVGLGVFVLGYFWICVGLPFREGLKGQSLLRRRDAEL